MAPTEAVDSETEDDLPAASEPEHDLQDPESEQSDQDEVQFSTEFPTPTPLSMTCVNLYQQKLPLQVFAADP